MSHGNSQMEDATNKPNHVTVTVDPSGTVGCDPNPLPTAAT